MKNLKITLAVCIAAVSLNLGAQSWTTSGSNAVCTNGGATRLVVKNDGSIWVGNGTGVQKSSSVLFNVDGHMRAREVIVNMQNWPDYVFDSTYILMPLEIVQDIIDSTGHLPNVPSAREVEANGLNVAEMNAILMRKLEEMQLYILQLNTRIKELEKVQTNSN
jgi:hypothetical protein